MSALERRWVLALAVVLGLNLVGYLAFTLPRGLRQRGLASRHEALKGEVEVERRRQAAVRETSDTIESNTRDVQRFFQEVVGSRRPGLVASLKSIDELASAQGLKVGQQGFESEPVKGVQLERLKVTMPVEGSYRQIVGFLQGLERPSPHFLTLDQIAVKANEGGQAKLDLVLSCYFRAAAEGTP